LGLPVIASDRVGKALAGVSAMRPAPAEAYSATFSAQTYDELFRRATAVLCSGRGVMLDATFRDRDSRLRARQLAHHHRRPFRFVEAICDDATLRRRLRHRAAGPAISDATEELLEQIRREFEPVAELGGDEQLAVPTTQPLTNQVQIVRDTLAG
jgi:predicted kinase